MLRWVLLAGLAASACTAEEPAYRGLNLQTADLPASDVVSIYRAAAGGSFQVENPDLSILVDPLYLPRAAGLAGGDSIPPDLLRTLLATRWVRGVCSIPVTPQPDPLRCEAERSGYVVRYSPPFARGGDTVQVHMVVQQYAIPGGPVEQRLRFERAYYVVRSGGAWRAAREARLPQP